MPSASSLLAGAALFVLPDGVLEVTGASEAWELELVRWSGLTLMILVAAAASGRRRRLAVLRSTATVARLGLTAALGAAYLLTTFSLFLILAFCALVHVTLYVALLVFDDVHARARVRAGH